MVALILFPCRLAKEATAFVPCFSHENLPTPIQSGFVESPHKLTQCVALAFGFDRG